MSRLLTFSALSLAVVLLAAPGTSAQTPTTPPSAHAAAETKCKPNIIEFIGRRNSDWTYGGGYVYGITAENTSCFTAKFVAVRYLKFLAGVKPRLTGYTVKKDAAGKFVYRKGSAVIRFYDSADKSVRAR